MSPNRSIWDGIRALFQKRAKERSAPERMDEIPPVSSAPPESPDAPPVSVMGAARAMTVARKQEATEPESPRKDVIGQGDQPPIPEAPRRTSPPPQPKQHEVDLVIGVDLGTSCTKVVIGDPGWQDRFYAVPFGNERNGISGWLHTTRFAGEANLKLRLMREPFSEISQNLLACYLADVLRHSWNWFEQHAPAVYRNCEKRWSLCLGFPGRKVVDHPLRIPYLAVANLGVDLASCNDAPSLDLAQRVLSREVRPKRLIPLSRVRLYPEIAAQLAGYVQSPYKQRGNLLLIDVGAGTLDVSTIIVHDVDHQDVVSFHHCDVAELGVFQLFLRRAHALEERVPGCVRCDLDRMQDGTNRIPDTLEAFVEKSEPELEQAFRRVSREHEEQVVDTPFRCLVQFRNSLRRVHINPRYDPFGRSLRFFLTGGGSRSPFFQRIFADGLLENRLVNEGFTRWSRDHAQRARSEEGFRLEEFPFPGNLVNFPKRLNTEFDRMSVAYGLAYGQENLMRITAHEEAQHDPLQ